MKREKDGGMRPVTTGLTAVLLVLAGIGAAWLMIAGLVWPGMLVALGAIGVCLWKAMCIGGRRILRKAPVDDKNQPGGQAMGGLPGEVLAAGINGRLEQVLPEGAASVQVDVRDGTVLLAFCMQDMDVLAEIGREGVTFSAKYLNLEDAQLELGVPAEEVPDLGAFSERLRGFVQDAARLGGKEQSTRREN